MFVCGCVHRNRFIQYYRCINNIYYEICIFYFLHIFLSLFFILQNLKLPDRSGPGTVRNFVCIGRNESQWKAYIGNQDFKSFQESNNERKISFFLFYFTFFVITKKFWII